MGIECVRVFLNRRVVHPPNIDFEILASLEYLARRECYRFYRHATHSGLFGVFKQTWVDKADFWGDYGRLAHFNEWL